MVENEAPHSATGFAELDVLPPKMMSCWNSELDPVPVEFSARLRWQDGAGSHASASSAILVSVIITVSTQSDVTLATLHVVLDGSSQWVFGQNVTSKASILQLDGNGTEIPNTSVDRIRLSIFESNVHLYHAAKLVCAKPSISYTALRASDCTHVSSSSSQDANAILCCSQPSCNQPLFYYISPPSQHKFHPHLCVYPSKDYVLKAGDPPWPQVRSFIDRFHKHVLCRSLLRGME